MTNMRKREMRGRYPAALRAARRSLAHQCRVCRKGGLPGGIRSLT